MAAEQSLGWRFLLPEASPHFSPAFYCGSGSGHVYNVALGRAPYIHARLHRLATKSGEKSGLGPDHEGYLCFAGTFRAAANKNQTMVQTTSVATDVVYLPVLDSDYS
jgi:hypothetical protein